MNTKHYHFAGCNVRLISDTPVYDSNLFENFRCKEFSKAECDIEISIFHSALPLKNGNPVFFDETCAYYREDGKGYYFASYPTAQGIKEFACRITEGDTVTLLVVPGQKLWDSLVAFAVNYTQLLFEKGIGTMHASCIEVNGKALLFAGDKGVGKSTQAALWNRYRGAQIINGDRIAIRTEESGIIACGIPFCGSSKIAVNKSLGVKAVILPGKAAENSLVRLSTVDAFKQVLGKLTYYPEDVIQLTAAADIAKRIAETVPVYQLLCRPDESAVILLEEQLCQI